MATYIVFQKSSGSDLRALSVKYTEMSPKVREERFRELSQLNLENPSRKKIIKVLDKYEEKGIVKPLTNYRNPGAISASVIKLPREEYVGAEEEQIGEIKDSLLDVAEVTKDKPIELISPVVPMARQSTTRLIHPIDGPNPDIKIREEELTEEDLWHLDRIRLSVCRERGFELTGKNIKIGILDTGIDGHHPALSGKVVESYKYSGDNFSKESYPIDYYGHGTHVAGLICGRKVGVAEDAKLYSYVALPNRGKGTISSFIKAVNFASRNPEISILNISVGFPGFASNEPLIKSLTKAFKELRALDVLLVCAIGNEGRDHPCQPGTFREVISVGSIKKGDRVSNFSAYGDMSIGSYPEQHYKVPTLVAPGEDVYSSLLGGGYQKLSGTSMAAPIVSGIAALILEKFKREEKALDLLGLEEEILARCDRLDDYHDRRQGRGVVQVEK